MVERQTPEPEVGGVETFLRHVVSLSKTLYSPKVLVLNTLEVLAPSRLD